MKKHIISLVFVLSVINLNAQFSYTSFLGDVYDMRPIEKTNIVVLVPSSWPIIDEVALDSISSQMDRMYQCYKNSMGFEPGGGLPAYSNKCPVAFVTETCGAGCGYIGFKGVEIGLFYLDKMVRESLNNSNLNAIGIVGYEFGRNFFTPEIQSKLSFSNNQMAFSNGFATYMGCKATFYAGTIPESGKLTSETYFWYNELYTGFLSFLVQPEISANVLFTTDTIFSDRYRIPRGSTGIFKEAGLLVFLDSVLLDQGLFPNFWFHLKNQPNGTTNQQVFDNIAIASSKATELNLKGFFTDLLRFDLSASAINEISQFPEPMGSSLIKDIGNFNLAGRESDIVVLTSAIKPKGLNLHYRLLVNHGDEIVFEDSTTNICYQLPINECFSTCVDSEDRILTIQSIQDNQLVDSYTINLHYWDTISTTGNVIQFAHDSFLGSYMGTGSSSINLEDNSIKISSTGTILDDNRIEYPFRDIKGHAYKYSALVKTSLNGYVTIGIGSIYGPSYTPPFTSSDTSLFTKIEGVYFQALPDSFYTQPSGEHKFFFNLVNEGGFGPQYAIIKDVQFIDVNLDEVLWNLMPVKPIITISKDTLISDHTSGNQWYLNGNIIQDAIAQTYKPKESGTYTLTVTNGDCISEISDPVDFAINSIPEDLQKGITYYPNPAKNKLTVKGLPPTSKITVYNLMGKVMMEVDTKGSETEIDLFSYKPGAYFLKIISKEEIQTFKFIKE